MDTFSPEKRSEVMSRIRATNTKPEVYFRKLLFQQGLRYSLHPKKIFGRPDFYLAKYKTAVFVHGCFWHMHSDPKCKIGRIPKSRQDYWIPKFERNIARDQEVIEHLHQQGIKTLIVWECTVNEIKKNQEFRNQKINEAVSFIKDSNSIHLVL